jgi:hypothetical protein
MTRIAFDSRMTVKHGKEPVFVRACRGPAAEVARNESPAETPWVGFSTLRDGGAGYAVRASFASRNAEHQHMRSPWRGSRLQPFVGGLAGTWEREYLDPPS